MPGLIDLAAGRPNPDKPPYWQGFIQSTLSAPLELFGMEPSPEVDAFRAGRPFSSFATQIIGGSVPYLGWGKVSKAIGPLERLIEGTGDIAKAPIVTRAARESLRFAPFEAGRGLIASTVGGEDPGQEFLQSTLNTGFAGAVGGVLGAFESAGRLGSKKPLIEIAPGVEPDAPLQIRLRQLRNSIAEGAVTDPALANARLATWLADARREVPGIGQRHLGNFEGEGGGDLARQVERLFFKPDNVSEAAKSNKGWIVRQFTNAGNLGAGKGYSGFQGEAAWRAAATEAGLPDDFVYQGQFFRYITARNEKAVRNLEKTAAKLTKVGNWHIGKEADGNYVVLRRLEDLGDGLSSGTRWVAFKTDRPSLFSSELKAWDDVDNRWQSWISPDQANFDAGGQVMKAGMQLNRELPYVEYTEFQKTGKLPQALRNITGPLGEGLENVTTRYLTPTMNQFARSPVANWIWRGASDLWNIADLKANDLMLGMRPLRDAKDVVAAIALGTRPSSAGISGRIASLSDEQIRQYWRLDALRPSPTQLDEMAAAGEVDEAVYQTFKDNAADVRSAYESLNKTLKALGKKTITLKDGHSGLNRRWEGTLKQGLLDEAGNLVAMADANNMAALAKRVQFIEGKLADEGITGLRQSKVYTGEGPMPRELYFSKDFNVRGFRGDFGEWEKLTRQELLTAYNESLRARFRSEAEEAFNALYANDLKKLGELDPRTFDALQAKVDILKGKEGPISRIIDKVVDPVLAPILGKGSAGKIVDAVNNAFWHLQLGAFNFGYPVANLVGIFQTVLPEIAYVMNGVPERLAPYYSWQLVQGTKGPAGIMSILDPLKLMAQGTKAIFAPDDTMLKALNRATGDGVIDPKFLEEFGGESLSRVRRLRDVLKGRESLPGAIGALSSWMPAASERLTRAMAFGTAYKVGQDVLGLSDDALYYFAKKFVDRTMYRYSQADRAAILTSPVGRLFGSMKNWVNHYISNMMLYAGEASRGNIAPLAWQMATTGAVGGLSAVPLMPLIGNNFAEQVQDKNLVDWIYSAMGQRGGDALYLGLPASLGLSLSTATASPIRDANMLFSFAISDRAKAMGRTVGAAVDHWQATGQHPATSELARGAFARAFAPKALYRYLQVYDNPGLESLSTGYPIVDELNPWNKVLYSAGFQPSEIERGFVVFEEMMKDKKKQRDSIVGYGTAMAQALKTGDSEAIDRIVGRVIVEGIDLSSVMRSANARIDKDTKGMLERNFDAAQRSAYSSVIGER